jgi:hypothetical protein
MIQSTLHSRFVRRTRLLRDGFSKPQREGVTASVRRYPIETPHASWYGAGINDSLLRFNSVRIHSLKSLVLMDIIAEVPCLPNKSSYCN